MYGVDSGCEYRYDIGNYHREHSPMVSMLVAHVVAGCTITKDMSFLTCDFPCKKFALQSKESAPQGRWFAKFAVRGLCEAYTLQLHMLRSTPGCVVWLLVCMVGGVVAVGLLWLLWLFCAVFASYFGGCLFGVSGLTC